MQKMITSLVSLKSTFGINDSSYDGIKLNKPMLCPCCNAFVDGVISSKLLHPRSKNIQYGSVCYSCPHCKEYYVATFKIDFENKECILCALAPSPSLGYENHILSQISPRRNGLNVYGGIEMRYAVIAKLFPDGRINA